MNSGKAAYQHKVKGRGGELVTECPVVGATTTRPLVKMKVILQEEVDGGGGRVWIYSKKYKQKVEKVPGRQWSEMGPGR